MTIKPIVEHSSNHSSTTDAEGINETRAGQVVDKAVNQTHRNTIDGHGQSSPRHSEVYEERGRTHRCSPHKSSRSKRRDNHYDQNHKRERVDRENLTTVVVTGSGTTNTHGAVANPSSSATINPVVLGRSKTPEHLILPCQSGSKSQKSVPQVAGNLLKTVEEKFSGYNSGDEHLHPKEGAPTTEEWQRRDDQFAKCMNERGYELKQVEEDGACLFRSISLQIYGDADMHDVIRQHTMDYIYKNREYFSHFVTEDINCYIKRKRRKDSHGNHIEIQAISEIYSRPVELYCYKSTPINIFNSEQSNKGYAPLRLSYQRGSHYNAIIDPYNATVGVGLGLAGYKPELQTKEAVRLSEELEIEQTMFEDKLKTTDWEATNEAIEEQIARESYLQWCRDNLQRSPPTNDATTSTSSTVTSAKSLSSDTEASPSKYSLQHSSTVTAPVTINSTANVNGTATSGLVLGGITNNSLDHAFGFSPKSLSQYAYNLKKDSNELGYDNDTTDMSSGSSLGHCPLNSNCGGNMSPTQRIPKKSKTRLHNCNTTSTVGNTLRSCKKRRSDHISNVTKTVPSLSKSDDVSARKSLKLEIQKDAAVISLKRSKSPEADQKPCTSKQSKAPEKKENLVSPTRTSGSAGASVKQPFSSFYRDLLEASYANYGFGQLSESEMLQRAIQMSTEDFIEDQKQKYLYGP